MSITSQLVISLKKAAVLAVIPVEKSNFNCSKWRFKNVGVGELIKISLIKYLEILGNKKGVKTHYRMLY